jgi:hypothetical protein
MKRASIAVALLWLSSSLSVSRAAIAQTPDNFQRFIKIHNSLDQTIYPVIQSPQDLPDPDKPASKGTNCATGGSLGIPL